MASVIRQILISVCKLLNKHDVEYMLIGGMAVGFHGYPRYTADIDLWYNPTVSNFTNILKALDDLGIDTSSLQSVVFDPEKTFLRIPDLGVRVEFLPHIPGVVSFKNASRSAVKTNDMMT
jgi:hypothetical protein